MLPAHSEDHLSPADHVTQMLRSEIRILVLRGQKVMIDADREGGGGRKL
jgi:hypothetical protein